LKAKRSYTWKISTENTLRRECSSRDTAHAQWATSLNTEKLQFNILLTAILRCYAHGKQQK